MWEPRFLTFEEVVFLHQRGLDLFGGEAGLRDKGLLDSAVHAPQASMGGKFLNGTIEEMAATYLFSLVGNHPFVDGNKRVGFYAADTFLTLNGLDLRLQEPAAE